MFFKFLGIFFLKFSLDNRETESCYRDGRIDNSLIINELRKWAAQPRNSLILNDL